MTRNLLCLFILTFTSSVTASELIGIFKLPYGQPYPPYTNNRDKMGLPIEFQSVRLPMQSKDKLSVFHDYKLIYWVDSGAIYSAQASRVYKDPSKCVEDSELVKAGVINGLPNMSKDERYTFSNPELVVDVSCAIAQGEYFYELSLMVFHREMLEKIGKDHR